MKRTTLTLAGFGAMVTTIVVSLKLYRIQEHIMEAHGKVETPLLWTLIGPILLALGGSLAVWQSSSARRSKTTAVCANLVVLAVCAEFAWGLAGPSIPPHHWSSLCLGLISPIIGFCALFGLATAAWVND